MGSGRRVPAGTGGLGTRSWGRSSVGRGSGAPVTGGGRGRGGAWQETRPSRYRRQRRLDSGADRFRRAAHGRPQPRGTLVPPVSWLRDPGDLAASSLPPGPPSRRQRLPRERPSAPGARGKSPSVPMSERLPHDGHARGRGFSSPLPSSGNPL